MAEWQQFAPQKKITARFFSRLDTELERNGAII